jgi:hypothetical protein
MTRRLLAEELLREMRSSVAPVDAPEAEQNRRERTIADLRGVQTKVLVERKASHIRRQAAAAVAVLAALAAGFVFYSQPRDRHVAESATPATPQTTVRALEGRITVIHAGRETLQGLDVGVPLEAGDTVRTGEFRAVLTMQSRAAVDVSPSTKLSLGALQRAGAEWVELEVGRVDVSVPKLRDGKTLSVHTPHATVTVHGTRFSVLVAPSAGSTVQTTVEVREGAVQVEHDGRTTELLSGDVWTSANTTSTSSASGAFQQNHAETAHLQTATPPSHATPSRERTANASRASGEGQANAVDFASPPTSTLSAENTLMQRAMVASRNGDDRAAIDILETLLSRYPRSILKENARVERSRAVARLEAAQATGP